MDAFPDYPEGANPDDYLSLKRLYDLSREMARCEEEARVLGYESVEDLYLKVTKYMESELKGTSSVCAQVTIKISQTVSLTREAFEGTLTLFNGHENKDMTDVRLQLVVTDAFGKDCTDLFDIGELPERFVELRDAVARRAGLRTPDEEKRGLDLLTTSCFGFSAYVRHWTRIGVDGPDDAAG